MKTSCKEDTNANIAYNTVFKRTWTMGTIIVATIQSYIGMSFMFLLFLNNNNSKILFILSVILPSSIILAYFI